MTPTNRLPLFCVTGASGVGKSTICERLFQRERRYIVLESDILWSDHFNTPGDNYRQYREMWLRMCANVSQIGLPVVLCGCVTPEQFDVCAHRALVSDIHYLSIVCDPATLEHRMRDGRSITDPGHLGSSIQFNNWLMENGPKQGIALVDNTDGDVEAAAQAVDAWILARL